MVILYIYLGTVVFCLSSAFLTSKAMDREFEKKGYTYNKKNKNVYKDIIEFLGGFGFCLVPLFNIMLGVHCILNLEKDTESLFENYLADGTLIKIEEIKDDIVYDSKDDNSNEVIVYNVNSELTREEKIKFLKEEYFRLTNKKIDTNSKKHKSKQKRKL